MFVIGAPTDGELARVLGRVHDTPLTYGEVGATLAATVVPGPTDPPATSAASGDTAGHATPPAPAAAAVPPPGYHGAHARRVVGHGDADYAAACDAIRSWSMHRGQGFRVAPDDPPIALGTEVVTAVPLAGPVHVLAACRIVAVVDDPGRFGFAYGTLAVHPASGEEAFVVERTPEGEVIGEITAFSRPRHPLVRLGGPVARRQQARATEGYLDALARYVRDAPV
ncbi:MAG TPA: DUF1990 domain-containing protein [Acidimicrobiales bacterium]|nr:DUF1990 domain-containing protein [Acidimicrobiales bacterium]